MWKKYKKIIVIAVVLRLLLSAFTYHSDIQPFYFAGSVMSEGNVANFYDYLPSLPVDHKIRKVFPDYLFNYPPAVYFSLGPVSYLLALPVDSRVREDFIFQPTEIFGNISGILLLMLVKLPFLPFDLAIAWFLYKFFDKENEKKLALMFWLFNPLTLYATYMMGQFDIIPTFFVMCALVRIKNKSENKNYLFEAFLLGLGAAFKIYPILFLAPLALNKTKWVERISIVGVGVLTYIASILPFINSSGFRATALVAGQTMKSFYAKIDVSGGEAILLFPAAILFIYIVFLVRGKVRSVNLWQRFFAILTVFFVFTHSHPQWLLWLTPFLIIDLVESRLRHWPLVVLVGVSFVTLLTFFDAGLTIWLFAPIAPNLYGLPDIWGLIGKSVDINFMRSLFHSVFVAVGVYYIYHHTLSTKTS